MNIFDILGPIMVGPSSSHTAGAVRIGLITRKLLGCKPVKADIQLHGSFAATGKGHGTDKALIAGLLDMQPDDTRIPDSFRLAEEQQLSFNINNTELSGAHPNTAILAVTDEADRCITIQASSLGGGRIMVNKLDGITVDFTGEHPTLIIYNMDQPGLVAEVASVLSDKSVNIGTMQLFRNKRGGTAVMVMETDSQIPEKLINGLLNKAGVIKVTYINL